MLVQDDDGGKAGGRTEDRGAGADNHTAGGRLRPAVGQQRCGDTAPAHPVRQAGGVGHVRHDEQDVAAAQRRGQQRSAVGGGGDAHHGDRTVEGGVPELR